jgi:hypothetical protein
MFSLPASRPETALFMVKMGHGEQNEKDISNHSFDTHHYHYLGLRIRSRADFKCE